MATDTLNIVITTKAKGDGAKKAETGLNKLVKAAKAFAAAAAVGAVAKQAVELGKLGIASQAASLRFERFAGTAESAEHFLDAFNAGAEGTVDRMTAMASSSKLLQMGLVETSSEMEQIASMAVKLGDQTMGAGNRINDFSLMLANTSVPRLDNFGISSGRVRERMKELQATGQALNREEAFKMATMEEGAKALERLGDVTETTAHQMDVAKASWQDMKIAMGDVIATAGASTGIFGAVSDRLRGVADMYQAVSEHGKSTQAVFAAWLSVFDKTTTMTEAYIAALEKENQVTVDAATGQRLLSGEYERSHPPMEKIISDTEQLTARQNMARRAMDALNAEQDELAQAAFGSSEALSTEASAMEKAARSALELASAEEEAQRSAQAHAEYLFDASMSFTDFYRRQEETAESANQRLEDAETKHQEKLAKLAEKGQSKAIRIDADAEEEKLKALQRKLEIALVAEADFTDKTKQATRMRKEDQISSLQKQIAQQEQLLGDYHAGRLRTQGQNVDNLIAEENRRYDEELSLLEENRAAQEAEQKRSLGKMVLQHFDAWAQMTFGTENLTEEQIAFVNQARMDIVSEYGLMEQGAADHLVKMQNDWSASFNQMQGDANAFFNGFMARFNALPTEHVLRIRTELSGRPEDIPTGDTRLDTDPAPKVIIEDDDDITTGTGGELEGGGGLLSRTLITTGTAALMNTGGGARVGGGLTIGPVYITNSNPAEIWKQLEQHARLKGKSGWQQLGR